jgi:hypothetical protein
LIPAGAATADSINALRCVTRKVDKMPGKYIIIWHFIPVETRSNSKLSPKEGNKR